MVLELFVLLAMIILGSLACIVVVTAFAIGMGWIPGMNLDMFKLALKEMYQEIFKGKKI